MPYSVERFSPGHNQHSNLYIMEDEAGEHETVVEAFAAYLHRVGATETVDVGYAASMMKHPSFG